MYRHLFASAAVFLLLSGSANAAEKFPFEGSWKVTGAVTGPWADPDKPLITDDEQKLKGKIVKIKRGKITGAYLMDCGKTEMNIENLPVAALFEGMLAVDPKNHAGPSDEAKAARAAKIMGFTGEPVPTLFQGCSEITLHKRDATTLFFGMNDKIFELKKQ